MKFIEMQKLLYYEFPLIDSSLNIKNLLCFNIHFLLWKFPHVKLEFCWVPTTKKNHWRIRRTNFFFHLFLLPHNWGNLLWNVSCPDFNFCVCNVKTCSLRLQCLNKFSGLLNSEYWKIWYVLFTKLMPSINLKFCGIHWIIYFLI